MPDVNNSARHVASTISTASSSTVVQINYRVSSPHTYPTPIHDVLTGYDWVIEHLLPNRAIRRVGHSIKHAVKMAVCGELVGGGLATMLALTECRPGKGRPYIAAAAINEPVVDWVFPEDGVDEDDDYVIDFDTLGSGHQPVSRTAPTKSSKSRKSNVIIPSFLGFANNGTLDTDALVRARNTLFRKPEDYHDTFASPILNFRTAGMAVMPPPPPPQSPKANLSDFDEAAKFEREDFHRQQLSLSAMRSPSPNATAGQNEAEAQTKTTKTKATRKSHKRFPGTASGLSVPDMHISVGDTSPLSDQAVELAMLIRRSVLAQRKHDAKTPEQAEADREQAFLHAEKKAQVTIREGIRFWGNQSESNHLWSTARWLRESLE